tara:strand:+ start:7616 stop:7900 length:285 start_codon:yes stop_codon:yes gene_type:complete
MPSALDANRLALQAQRGETFKRGKITTLPFRSDARQSVDDCRPNTNHHLLAKVAAKKILPSVTQSNSTQRICYANRSNRALQVKKGHHYCINTR